MPNNIDRLLKRSGVDEMEIELVRVRSLQRLAAISDSSRAAGRSIGAEESSERPTASDEPTDEDAGGTDDEVRGDVADADAQPGEAVAAYRAAHKTRAPAEGQADAEEVGGQIGRATTSAPETREGEGATVFETDDDAADAGAKRPAIVVVGSRRREAASEDDDREADVGPDRADGPDQAALFPDERLDTTMAGDGGEAVETAAAVTAPVAADSSTVDTSTVDTSRVDTSLVDTSAIGQSRSESAGSGLEGPAPEVYCPYCATILDPPPSGTKRCGRCHNRILVRHIGARTVYLTEAAMPVFEAEQRRLAEVARQAVIRDRWLELARQHGAAPDRIERITRDEASDARVAAARALYLTSVDEAFADAARREHWDDAARLRYDESLVLFELAGVEPPAWDDAEEPATDPS